MSISLITNFQVNTNSPIDTRLVATGPDALNNMEYKYEGLTVYRTDTQLQYVWDGTTWEISSDGIYGGSGSLVGDTHIGFGFLGTGSGDESLKFLMSASSSLETFNQQSYFSRNTSGDAQFSNSLLFGTQSGPYITFNPSYDVGFGRGGIAIGTGNITTQERFRIESSGVIKFKPINSFTASLSIYQTDGDLSLGYNWYGSKEDSSDGSSFLKFNNQSFTINHSEISANTYTHSVIFYHPNNNFTLDVNGNLRVKNIQLGASTTYHTISNDGVGFGISKDDEEFSIFNNLNTKSIVLKNNLIDFGSMDYHLTITSSTTFSVYGMFESKFKTNIWDNAFNVDRVNLDDATETDNYWTRLPNAIDSFNDLSQTNAVKVELSTSTYSQDAQFIFNTDGYTSKDSISSWKTSKKPYDRFFYFYNNTSEYHIPHELTWYLSNDDGTSWKKIGIVETGNLDNYNQESGATGSYAVRYYSNSALVPAHMEFKIKLSFKNDYTPDFVIGSSSAPSVVVAVLRSGKWRTENSSETISNI